MGEYNCLICQIDGNMKQFIFCVLHNCYTTLTLSDLICYQFVITTRCFTLRYSIILRNTMHYKLSLTHWNYSFFFFTEYLDWFSENCNNTSLWEHTDRCSTKSVKEFFRNMQKRVQTEVRTENNETILLASNVIKYITRRK